MMYPRSFAALGSQGILVSRMDVVPIEGSLLALSELPRVFKIKRATLETKKVQKQVHRKREAS